MAGRVGKYPEDAQCMVEDCESKPKAKGLCASHYAARQRELYAEAGRKCKLGDGRPVHAGDLCAAHYQRQKVGLPMDAPIRMHKRFKDPVCEVEGCNKPEAARGLCLTHGLREKRGEPDWQRPVKDKAPNGAGHVNRNGYRMVYRPGTDEIVMEHRLVMELMLGRRLLLGENVHHKNGQRADNRPGNLELWITAQPVGKRDKDLVAFAREMLGRYGDEAERARYGGD